MTESEFYSKASKLFGEDKMKWRFVCPACKHIASVQDYKDAGAPSGAIGFSCIGRFIENSRDWLRSTGDGPCNYTGGGLFKINPVKVVHPDGKTTNMFDFDRAMPQTEEQ